MHGLTAPHELLTVSHSLAVPLTCWEFLFLQENLIHLIRGQNEVEVVFISVFIVKRVSSHPGFFVSLLPKVTELKENITATQTHLLFLFLLACMLLIFNV